MPLRVAPAATALVPAPVGSSIRQRRLPSAVSARPASGVAATLQSRPAALAAGPAAATSTTPAKRPAATSAVAGIDQSAAASAGGAVIASASTVTAKASEAEPPELVAVTVTVSERRAAVGIAIAPVAASTVAPAPATAKRRPPPRNAGAASRVKLPGAWSRISSSSTPATATGAGQVTASPAVVASLLPAAVRAVTRQLSVVRSSSGPGR